MKLDQLFEGVDSVPNDRYDASADKSQLKAENTRKVRLTLEQINKLRRMNEVRKVELKKQHKFFQTIYGQPPPQ